MSFLAIKFFFCQQKKGVGKVKKKIQVFTKLLYSIFE